MLMAVNAAPAAGPSPMILGDAAVALNNAGYLCEQLRGILVRLRGETPLNGATAALPTCLKDTVRDIVERQNEATGLLTEISELV